MPPMLLLLLLLPLPPQLPPPSSAVTAAEEHCHWHAGGRALLPYQPLKIPALEVHLRARLGAPALVAEMVRHPLCCVPAAWAQPAAAGSLTQALTLRSTVRSLAAALMQQQLQPSHPKPAGAPLQPMGPRAGIELHAVTPDAAWMATLTTEAETLPDCGL